MTDVVSFTIDKSGWGEGPWLSEPDRVEWRDEATGLPCLAVRQPRLGHWCGYVGVHKGHKFHGVDYSVCPMGDKCPDFKPGESYQWCGHSPDSALNVHGGITYSAKCSGNICHVPADGEADDVFWFGFDCAHSGDLVPSIDSMRKPGGHLHGIHAEVDMGESYKSLAFIEAECAALAKQLAGMNEASA